MFNPINNCFSSLLDHAKQEVTTWEDVPKVFASRVLVSGVAYAAFSITAKSLSFICQQAGFPSLANRVALPVLTSNIWVPLAVIVFIPAVITLYQLIKNYYVEEEDNSPEPTLELISAAELTKSADEAYEKIHEILKQPGSLVENTLFNEADHRILLKKRLALFVLFLILFLVSLIRRR